MITISSALQEQITNSHLLRDGLERGILNLSAVARQLQPFIAKRAQKEVTVNAVLLSLQRIEKQISERENASSSKDSVLQLDSVINKTGLVALKIKSESSINNALSAVAASGIRQSEYEYFHFDVGSHIYLFFDHSIEPAIRRALTGNFESKELSYDNSLFIVNYKNSPTSNISKTLASEIYWSSVQVKLFYAADSTAYIVVPKTESQKVSSLLNTN